MPIYSAAGVSDGIMILFLFVIQSSLDAPSSLFSFDFQDTHVCILVICTLLSFICMIVLLSPHFLQ